MRSLLCVRFHYCMSSLNSLKSIWKTDHMSSLSGVISIRFWDYCCFYLKTVEEIASSNTRRNMIAWYLTWFCLYNNRSKLHNYSYWNVLFCLFLLEYVMNFGFVESTSEIKCQLNLYFTLICNAMKDCSCGLPFPCDRCNLC